MLCVCVTASAIIHSFHLEVSFLNVFDKQYLLIFLRFLKKVLDIFCSNLSSNFPEKSLQIKKSTKSFHKSLGLKLATNQCSYEPSVSHHFQIQNPCVIRMHSVHSLTNIVLSTVFCN